MRHDDAPLIRIVILLVVVPMLIALYALMFQFRAAQIAGCERGNGSRVAQLSLANDLVAVNRRRIEAPGSSPTEKAANRFALARYKRDRSLLIDSQESVAESPGSVEADCEKAYPRPFPFDLFG